MHSVRNVVKNTVIVVLVHRKRNDAREIKRRTKRGKIAVKQLNGIG